MVLKNDDHTGDCPEIDANEDLSSSNKRANDSKEVFVSGMDKNDGSGSCETGLINNLGQGIEAVDLRTNSGSSGLGYDVEDRTLESRKLSKISESTIQKLSVSVSVKSHGQNEKVMQSNEVTESDEKCEPSSQASPRDDVDESDVEEEDVKVCDICGDAGREDLLAVCSRCSDGAEHTYCMREMLDKVPEGDWFCEECKLNEDLEARRQEPIKLLGSTESRKSLGRTSSANSEHSFKLDNKDSFCERSKSKNVSLSKQLSSKRSGDSIEAGPTAKKQALESSTGSPTALSPGRVAVLSKESSFKNMDKTKGKTTNQFSTGSESAGESSENTRSPTRNSSHVLKGNFVKSNSFSSASSKPNVKVSEEVVQKQKQGGDIKDGPGKLSGKSMSFKGLGRSSVSEPKVKMLSPKCAPVQELKGQKQVRDRSSFERKNTIKLDNSFPAQTAVNSTKRLSRVDSRDYKNAQSDGKLASSGEVKRLSSTNIRGSGTSSSAEAKPSHVSLKDGATLNSSRVIDSSLVGINGAKADVHDSQSEKAPENTFGRSRQGLNNGALVSGNRRGLSTDAPILRAKDGMREENKLKAAIEAAMQKKQDIFKKNKIPEKVNELVSNAQGNHVGDQVIDSIPEEEVHERDAGLANHTSNSCKHASISSVKQSKVYPTDSVISSEEDSVLTVSSIPEQEAVWQGGFEIHRNGKLPDVCGSFQAHLSSFASGKVLEVARKLPQKIVFNEVSRHCAWPFQFKEAGAREDNVALYFFAKDLESYMRSYKILLEYMMKNDLALKGNINGFELLVFPSNHLSHRSQRWNTLFFMWGVLRGRRAHFPDDKCTSLERPEVPISVSNMVSRVKDISSAACLSENTCLQRPAIGELSVSGSDDVVSRCDTSVVDGLPLQKSGCLSNGDCYDQGRNIAKVCLSSPTGQGNHEKGPDNYSSVSGSKASETGTAGLEDHSQLDPNIIVQHQNKMQELDCGNNLQDSKKSLSDHMLDKRENKREISSHASKVLMVGKQEGSVFYSEEQQGLYMVRKNVHKKPDNSLKQEERVVDNIHKNEGQVKLENNVKNEENVDSAGNNGSVKLEWEGSFKKEGCVDINVAVDGSMEDLDDALQYSPKSQSNEDSTKPTLETASVISCQKRPWVDRKDVSEGGDQACIIKRLKGADAYYGCEPRRLPSSFSDRVTSQMHDVSTSSNAEDTSNKAVDEKLVSVNPGSAERCFFLVDSHAAPSVPSEDNLSPWKVSLLGKEDRLPDGSPNLELALGVEKKQSRKGGLPFFAGIVDRKGPDRPPDIASSKVEDEDASASLSLSLAFPFSDIDSPVRSERPRTAVEEALPARREANTSLLFFRGSSDK